MDEALRAASRAGDPLERATALRRGGRNLAARRVLQDAARAGQGRALARLEEWFPIPPRLYELLGWIESAVRSPQPGPRAAFGVTSELVGWCDPRVDLALFPVARRCLVGAVHDPWEWVLAGLRENEPVARVAGLLEGHGGGRCLSRIWLWEHEAFELADLIAAGQGSDHGRAAHDMSRWLDPLWVLGRFGGQGAVGRLERAARERDRRVRLTAQLGLLALGGAPPPSVREGLPATPSWSESVGPAWRDPFTGAWDRRFLRKHWQGSHVEAPPLDEEELTCAPALADPALWVLYVDVDRLGQLNDRHGFPLGDRVLLAVSDLLVELAGDRVARWAGDEFMVHWEGDDGPALAEAIRAGVAALELAGDGDESVRPTVTVGVARSGPFAEAYQRVDQALWQPRNQGLRDVVRVLV